MIEWLLKEEEKNKVGRPKLASDEVLNKAKKSIVICTLIVFVMLFSFLSIIKGTSPVKYAYHITFEKLLGLVENKTGFTVRESYDNDKNFIMEFKVGDLVLNKNLEYRYILYELKNGNWKIIDKKKVTKNKQKFFIKFNSEKNQNRTFKINMYVKGSKKIDKSFMPYGWETVSNNTKNELSSYKIVTVKGYYSPIGINEIKDALKNGDKITITTPKKNPRMFILKLNDTYKVEVKYTDETGKNVLLSNKTQTDLAKYVIPKINRVSEVTFNIYGDKSVLEKNMLDNWTIKEDKKGNCYITNKYNLKPESVY